MENDSSSWLAASLRFTFFFPLSVTATGKVSWQDLTGSLPDQHKENPKIGFLEEEGRFEKGSLSLQIQPGRTDLIYSNTLPQDYKEISGIPHVGSFSDGKEILIPLAEKLLIKLGKIEGLSLVRMALGFDLLIPENSHKEGYVRVNTFLPDVTVDPNSSDFTYAINRKRNSRTGINNLEINRMSRWQVRRLSLGSDSSGSAADFFACTALLDINTIPKDNFEIPLSKAIDVFKELVDMADEISEAGDIP